VVVVPVVPEQQLLLVLLLSLAELPAGEETLQSVLWQDPYFFLLKVDLVLSVLAPLTNR